MKCRKVHISEGQGTEAFMTYWRPHPLEFIFYSTGTNSFSIVQGQIMFKRKHTIHSSS